mmetsp:Transcript_52934/g.123707  ORF Transcript_52934/g.123707 Transcript_52934/m.123707 type:complete len:463 (-) Transcript_52934:122-1510(-)
MVHAGREAPEPKERNYTIQTDVTIPGEKKQLNAPATTSPAPRERPHTIVASNYRPGMPTYLNAEEQAVCRRQLALSSFFKKCSEHHLNLVCNNTEKKFYQRGDVVQQQGTPQTEAFILVEGDAVRIREAGGAQHQIEIPQRGSLFGSMHLLPADPAFATIKCLTDVVVYSIRRERLRQVMAKNPLLSEEVIFGLTQEIRAYTKLTRTGILEQKHTAKVPILPTSIAAAIESYYRSAMNTMINYRLTGQRAASFLPNMHIQTPTRVLYINGFKGIRWWLDQKFDKHELTLAQKLGLAVTPGIVMTPVSSILEATNAGHMNSEPLYKRWARGLMPRGVREVIFGVGLNQLSDWCEERTPHELPQPLRNALGSIAAGVCAGYFSHIPHNLSTLKLLTPAQSYAALFGGLVEQKQEALPKGFPEPLRKVAAGVLTVLWPRGLLVRTAQIVGSYVVLNGTIHLLKEY